MWWGDQQHKGLDLLRDLDRNLEPGESMTVRIPRSKDGIYSFNAKGEREYGLRYLYGHSFVQIPEGGIIVLPPDDVHDDIQTIFEASADVETVKETTLA